MIIYKKNQIFFIKEGAKNNLKKYTLKYIKIYIKMIIFKILLSILCNLLPWFKNILSNLIPLKELSCLIKIINIFKINKIITYI